MCLQLLQLNLYEWGSVSNLVIVLFDSTILWLSITLKDILAGRCKMSVAVAE